MPAGKFLFASNARDEGLIRANFYLARLDTIVLSK